MYRLMEDWTDIRERVASGKVSKLEDAQEDPNAQ
jgi:hypothetical protein